MLRMISATKLRKWVESAPNPDVKRSRRRWAYGYMTGASFRTMASWPTSRPGFDIQSL